MKNTLSKIFLAASVVALMGQGCLFRSPAPSEATPSRPEVMMPKESITDTDETMMPKDEAMMENNTTYQPYTKAAYEAAKLADKPIFLFFYANWCPTCREQEPRFQKVIPAHKGGVVALRVNYNDTETDSDEKELAKEFGVTYQHTGFFIGKDGIVKQKTIGTITDAKTTEFLDLISK